MTGQLAIAIALGVASGGCVLYAFRLGYRRGLASAERLAEDAFWRGVDRGHAELEWKDERAFG